jgi:hypothetical protein
MVKKLPTVVASAKRDIAIELIAFDGVHDIVNRDAVGFYHDVRLSPQGEPSRLAVLFSGTVMAVKPEAFGLPTLGDRESTFRTFAESAIGDFLDDSGLPEFTPGGVPAAKIDCFSPHFQTWRDRARAPDEELEAYLFAHAIHSWRYGHESWVLGPSDLLRLNQTFANVLRIVRLYSGEAWTISEVTKTRATLAPTPAFLRHKVTRKAASPPEPEPETVTPELTPAAFVYVDEARIADLRRLETTAFDLRKLVAFCEELNQCYRSQCYHAVAALTRGVIDHVPPIFGYRTFAEVVNNYSGTRSFKDCVRRLDEAGRRIADAHLHTAIRASEVLPTRVQVNFSNEVDVLLGEIVRLLQQQSKSG